MDRDKLKAASPGRPSGLHYALWQHLGGKGGQMGNYYGLGNGSTEISVRDGKGRASLHRHKRLLSTWRIFSLLQNLRTWRLRIGGRR